MPNLARLRAEGAVADYSRTNFPSKTAAGHAALWTGSLGITDGITSNKVPPMPWAQHTILETRDGFSSESLIAEPIFVTAARAGKRALVLQATHEAPFTTYAPGGRFGDGLKGSLGLLDGYSGVRDNEGVISIDGGTTYHEVAQGWKSLPNSVRPVLEGVMVLNRSQFATLVYDDPKDGVQGYDTLRLYAEHDGPLLAELKPAQGPNAWAGPVSVKTSRGPGAVYFRLFDLDPQLHHLQLYYTAPAQGQSNKPELAQRYYAEGAEFVAAGAIKSWEKGRFGRTMFQGGDGTAEDRYLETVHQAVDTYRRRARLAMASRDWDLLVSYVPFPDEAEHAWYGAVDDQSPTYDPKLAPIVWKRLQAVCREVDGFIGEVADGAGRDTVIAIASDHGMAGLGWKFFPNTALRKAGLLAVDAQGHVDLTKTKVMYSPCDGGYLVVNRVERKGGIVAPDDVAGVLAEALRALEPVKGPDGEAIATGVLVADAGTAELGIGGALGGEAYLNLRAGYYFDSAVDEHVDYKALEPGSGGHIFDPRRDDMHAIQSYWGPGVKRGVTFGSVRNSDLAPTVSRLLGMPAPAQATGRVLTEVLE
jgi:predicted AlkP superfamily phosphohydrolase/phosphomutase